MSFPLPDGICRPVCRPKRSTPRLVGPKDAARFAKAAVENGYECREVMKEVKKAIPCAACEKEIQDVDQGLQVLGEDAEAVVSAILNLLEAVGIPTKGTPEPDDKTIPETPWWKRLLRAVNVVTRVSEIVEAILTLYHAVNSLAATITQVVEAVRSLMQCCGGEKDGND